MPVCCYIAEGPTLTITLSSSAIGCHKWRKQGTSSGLYLLYLLSACPGWILSLIVARCIALVEFIYLYFELTLVDFIDTYCDDDLIGFYLSVCIVKYVRLVDFVYLYCECGWFCLSLFWLWTCLCLPCVRVCVVPRLLGWPWSLETKNNRRKRVREEKKRGKRVNTTDKGRQNGEDKQNFF